MLRIRLDVADDFAGAAGCQEGGDVLLSGEWRVRQQAVPVFLVKVKAELCLWPLVVGDFDVPVRDGNRPGRAAAGGQPEGDRGVEAQLPQLVIRRQPVLQVCGEHGG